jgi:hypothetical protein
MKDQLNVRVSREARNALSLVTMRYRVQPSQVVELAPFLFSWAAEASLRHRRERLKQLEDAAETLQKLERDTFDISFVDIEPPDSPHFLTEQIMRENRSIELEDLFGEFKQEDPDFYLDVNAIDPFTAFLWNLVADFPDISFEGWFPEGSPSYEVCPETAAQLFGGNRDVAAIILKGFVSLSEIPKEIRRPEMVKERVEWVLAKARIHQPFSQ